MAFRKAAASAARAPHPDGGGPTGSSDRGELRCATRRQQAEVERWGLWCPRSTQCSVPASRLARPGAGQTAPELNKGHGLTPVVAPSLWASWPDGTALAANGHVRPSACRSDGADPAGGSVCKVLRCATQATILRSTGEDGDAPRSINGSVPASLTRPGAGETAHR